MNRFKQVWASAAFGGTLLCGALAWAQSSTPGFEEVAIVTSIQGDLEDTWREHPELFQEMEGLRSDFIRSFAFRRGSYVDFSRRLGAFGEEGLLPLLWALSSDDPSVFGYDLRMWWNWRVALIDAIGRYEDPRSAPILLDLVEGLDPHRRTREVATAALGALLDDVVIDTLVDIARRDPRKRAAIVAGLGTARRSNALAYLMEVADGSSGELQRLAIRSMGDWANQWAWVTSGLGPYRADGEKGRQATISYLVDRFVHLEGPQRIEAIKSLQLAGSARSATYARLQAARRPLEAEHLEQLAIRMDRSPLP